MRWRRICFSRSRDVCRLGRCAIRKRSMLSLFLLLMVATVAGGQGNTASAPSPDFHDFDGRVADPAGKPLAGTEVWMLKFEDPMHGWTREATSDQDGHFVIRQVYKRPYDSEPEPGTLRIVSTMLWICLKGYAPKSTDISYRPSTGITLEPAGRISGRVVDPSGRPIARAGVSLHTTGCGFMLYAPPCPQGTTPPPTRRGPLRSSHWPPAPISSRPMLRVISPWETGARRLPPARPASPWCCLPVMTVMRGTGLGGESARTCLSRLPLRHVEADLAAEGQEIPGNRYLALLLGE